MITDIILGFSYHLKEEHVLVVIQLPFHKLPLRNIDLKANFGICWKEKTGFVTPVVPVAPPFGILNRACVFPA